MSNVYLWLRPGNQTKIFTHRLSPLGMAEDAKLFYDKRFKISFMAMQRATFK
ncbi:MAG: hypothetical protein Q7S53_01745 [bacterium]|nr:hypothetical protein [bacterium]